MEKIESGFCFRKEETKFWKKIMVKVYICQKRTYLYGK